jgi:enoyl-CoA hydratase/carnithine racemase
MNATTVNAQRDGRVLTVYLDNPPRNLMTRGMVKELDVLTCSIERDRTIRAVVITSGSSDAFLTHFDVNVFDYSPSLRALLPEATADLLRSRACLLPDTARKMVARLETTLRDNGAYGQSCLLEQFDPFCYAFLARTRGRPR